MAEFTIASQLLQKEDPSLGPVVEELRTLQVKRSQNAVNQIAVRAKWDKFGKGKAAGITSVSREDIKIEPASLLWGTDEEDKAAHRLVSATGKMTINTTKVVAGSTPSGTPGHSRRNSGANIGVVSGSDGNRSRNGSTASTGTEGAATSLPAPPESSS